MSDEAAGEPAEAVVPAGPEPTGDRRVDDALARLAELNGAPVSGHVEIFEEVHQRLQELLASADQEEPATPAPGRPVPGPGPPVPGPPVPSPPVPGRSPVPGPPTARPAPGPAQRPERGTPPEGASDSPGSWA